MRFFALRLRQAFPGYRGFTWLSDTKLAARQLAVLLRQPLEWKKQPNEDGSTEIYKPIWWTRGYSDSQIERVFSSGDRLVIDDEELIIDRIGLGINSNRFLNFIYVETIPDSISDSIADVCGLTADDLHNPVFESVAYGYEFSSGKVISTSEYADGGYLRNGQYYSADNFEWRVRHLKRHNFIVTHTNSYFHASETADIVEQFLDDALTRTVNEHDVLNFIERVEARSPKQRES